MDQTRPDETRLDQMDHMRLTRASPPPPPGDLMGRAMKNLDRLLAMPYGCGEQNMLLFAPNVFILDYLKTTGQLTRAIRDRATRFLESGERGGLVSPFKIKALLLHGNRTRL